jgi:transcriptional regulator with XRE-family HTH domain
MENLGLELKKAREAHGLTLSQVAARTKIAVTALDALERNDFSRLPGGIFGRSFVRAYALEVGTDPDETVARFIELLEQSEREAAERRAAMRPAITQDDRQFLERQRRALILLRVGLVVLAIATVALISWRVRVAMAARSAPAPVVEAAPAILPPQPADPISVPPPTAAEPMTDAAVLPTTPMVLEFDVSGDSWIQTTVDGAPPVARLFRAGDHHRIEAMKDVLLDVGNSGVFRLTIDGRPAKPLGREGARTRTRITRDNAAGFLQ